MSCSGVCVNICEVKHAAYKLCVWVKRGGQQVNRFSCWKGTLWLHLASQQSGRANLTLASAAQASHKWMEVKLGDSATRTVSNYHKKWLTSLIRRRQSQPETGFGISPGLPISSCWRLVDKTRVSLSATFLQNQLPTTDFTLCSEVLRVVQPT